MVVQVEEVKVQLSKAMLRRKLLLEQPPSYTIAKAMLQKVRNLQIAIQAKQTLLLNQVAINQAMNQIVHTVGTRLAHVAALVQWAMLVVLVHLQCSSLL